MTQSSLSDWLIRLADHSWEWMGTLAALVGLTILLGIGWVVIARARRDTLASSDDEEPDDLLGPLQDAYRRGQMDEEEFQRICATLDRDFPGAPRGLEAELLKFRWEKAQAAARDSQADDPTPAQDHPEASSEEPPPVTPP